MGAGREPNDLRPRVGEGDHHIEMTRLIAVQDRLTFRSRLIILFGLEFSVCNHTGPFQYNSLRHRLIPPMLYICPYLSTAYSFDSHEKHSITHFLFYILRFFLFSIDFCAKNNISSSHAGVIQNDQSSFFDSLSVFTINANKLNVTADSPIHYNPAHIHDMCAICVNLVGNVEYNISEANNNMPSHVRDILSYINYNFAAINNIIELVATCFDISITTLERYFKKYLAITPKRYLEDKNFPMHAGCLVRIAV